MVKSTDVPLDSVGVFEGVSSADDLSVSELVEDVQSHGQVPSLVPALDVPPGLAGGQDLVPSLAPALVPNFPLGSVGGQLASGSSREIVVSDSPGLHCSVSYGDWFAEAAKVEDGWTAVKRKKTKPSAPPFDMYL